jgi:hypothetical protein
VNKNQQIEKSDGVIIGSEVETTTAIKEKPIEPFSETQSMNIFISCEEVICSFFNHVVVGH